MSDFQLSPTDEAPIFLMVCDSGGPVDGLDVQLSVFDPHLCQFLDFSDLTFRSVPIQPNQTVIGIGNGTYCNPSLDLGTITNLVSDNLVARYHYTGSVNGCAADYWNLCLKATIDDLIACSTNATAIDYAAQTLTLFDTDGVTPLKIWPLCTDGGEPVAPAFGVPSQRKPSTI